MARETILIMNLLGGVEILMTVDREKEIELIADFCSKFYKQHPELLKDIVQNTLLEGAHNEPQPQSALEI